MKIKCQLTVRLNKEFRPFTFCKMLIPKVSLKKKKIPQALKPSQEKERTATIHQR